MSNNIFLHKPPPSEHRYLDHLCTTIITIPHCYITFLSNQAPEYKVLKKSFIYRIIEGKGTGIPFNPSMD